MEAGVKKKRALPDDFARKTPDALLDMVNAAINEYDEWRAAVEVEMP